MCGETHIPWDMCAGNTLPGETYVYHCDTGSLGIAFQGSGGYQITMYAIRSKAVGTSQKPI